MEPLGTRIASTIVEATVGGILMAGVIVLVRRIQIALGVKDDKPRDPDPASRTP